MDTWIVAMVRSRALRRAVAWAITLAAIAFLAFSQKRYFRNFFMGPYDVGQAELDAISDVATTPRYFVSVAGSQAIDTGIQQITIRKRYGSETGRSVSAAYYALVVGERLLICKSGSGMRKKVTGELDEMPSELSRRLFSDPDVQAIRARFYSFYLSDESFRVPGYIALAVMAVFVIMLLIKGVPAWRYYRDPSSHATVRRVGAWGDPIGVAFAVERAARAPKIKSSNGWMIGDEYLILSKFFSFDVLRVRDLLWAFKKVTKHSVNFIPTGKTYEAVLACYGGTATIQGKERNIDQILEFIAQKVPWAIFGFSNELQAYFNKNTREFSASVEQRRQEWARKQSAPEKQ